MNIGPRWEIYRRLQASFNTPTQNSFLVVKTISFISNRLNYKVKTPHKKQEQENTHKKTHTKSHSNKNQPQRKPGLSHMFPEQGLNPQQQEDEVITSVFSSDCNQINHRSRHLWRYYRYQYDNGLFLFQVARMVIVIAVTFIVSWSPQYLVTVISQLQTDSFLRESNFLFTMLMTHLFGFLNSCMNPFIYSAMSQRCRKKS